MFFVYKSGDNFIFEVHGVTRLRGIVDQLYQLVQLVDVVRQGGGCGCGALHRQDRILQPKLRGLDDGRHSADSPAVCSALPLLEWVVRDLIKVGAWDYQFS